MSGSRRSASAEAPSEAVVWFHRFLRSDASILTAAELAEWAEWSADPDNMQEIRRISQTWHRLDPVLARTPRPSASELAADDYDGSRPIAEWITEREEHYGTTTRVRWWALAASLAIACVGVLAYRYSTANSTNLQQHYATGASKRRWIMLPDGSTIVMSARTEISTRYTAAQRLVILDRGEAWFSVVGDPKHPFTVMAGSGAITALGTQFDVQRELGPSNVDRVTVSVDNGTVEVGATNTLQRAPSRLERGQEVSYDGTGRLGKIQTADLDAIEAWKQGQLVFRYTPLSQVVPRVSRYSDKPIRLDENDAELGEMPFTGTVFEGQVGDWLQALQEAYPVEVIDRPDGISLRKRHRTRRP